MTAREEAVPTGPLADELLGRAVAHHEENARGIGGAICRVLWYVVLGLLGLLLGMLVAFFGVDDTMSDLQIAAWRLLTAGGGLGAGLMLAFVISGDLGSELTSGGKAVKSIASSMVPSIVNQKLYGHPAFTLIVTVHNAKSVREVQGLLPNVFTALKSYDAYVTVECGENPPKSTCVRQDERFNETFRLAVRPVDAYIEVKLKDQDMLSDDVVGAARIPLSDIVQGGFPVYKAYPLDDGYKKTGQATLSFDWGPDFNKDKLDYLREQHPVEFQRREALRSDAQKSQQAFSATFAGTPYGTFSNADCQRVMQGTADAGAGFHRSHV